MRLLAAIGVLGQLLFTTGWLLDEVGLRGYHPASQTISALGAVSTERAWVWNIVVSLSGLSVIAAAVALYRLLDRSRASRAGVGLLLVWGFGFFLDGFFRLDRPDIPTLAAAMRTGSWHQRAHIVESVIDVTALTLAPFVLAGAFRQLPRWRTLAGPSLAFGAVVACADLWYLLDEGGAYAGIAERLLVTAASAWLALVGVWLLADCSKPATEEAFR